MGSDHVNDVNCGRSVRFQSTLPHGERRRIRLPPHQPLTFQSTLPHGERRASTCATPRPAWHFNPRSRMGSDHPVLLQFDAENAISIHAPAWGATSALAPGMAYLIFQSTLPHGERQGGGGGKTARIRFQSTLPHGERRSHTNLQSSSEHISIHAPAWGATRNPGCRI